MSDVTLDLPYAYDASLVPRGRRTSVGRLVSATAPFPVRVVGGDDVETVVRVVSGTGRPLRAVSYGGVSYRPADLEEPLAFADAHGRVGDLALPAPPHFPEAVGRVASLPGLALAFADVPGADLARLDADTRRREEAAFAVAAAAYGRHLLVVDGEVMVAAAEPCWEVRLGPVADAVTVRASWRPDGDPYATCFRADRREDALALARSTGRRVVAEVDVMQVAEPRLLCFDEASAAAKSVAAGYLRGRSSTGFRKGGRTQEFPALPRPLAGWSNAILMDASRMGVLAREAPARDDRDWAEGILGTYASLLDAMGAAPPGLRRVMSLALGPAEWTYLSWRDRVRRPAPETAYEEDETELAAFMP